MIIKYMNNIYIFADELLYFGGIIKILYFQKFLYIFKVC